MSPVRMPASRFVPGALTGERSRRTLPCKAMTSPMLSKYNIEYSVQFRRHSHSSHYLTDDPVGATEFLAELLEKGFRIVSIQHEGVTLHANEFDRLLKTAAGMLTARRLCQSLGIPAEEERFRFGFAA